MVNILIISEQAKPLTALMYGWNKYGGASLGLVQESINGAWDCQACGSENTEPPYDFEFAPREFIKLCVFCHRLRVANDIQTFESLIDLVRGQHSLLDNL